MDVQQDKTGKEFGLTKLWNAIYEACAERDPEFQKSDLQSFLKRQHLEHWWKNGGEPKDGAFQFIDRFVRRVIVGPLGERVRDLLCQERQERITRGLGEILGTWQERDVNQIGSPFFEGVMFASDRKQNINTRCILRNAKIKNRVVCADILILPVFDASDVPSGRDMKAWYLKNAVLWHAFLVPQSSRLTDPPEHSQIKGSVFVTKAETDIDNTVLIATRRNQFLDFYTSRNEVVFCMRSTEFEERLNLGRRSKDGQTSTRFLPVISDALSGAFEDFGRGYL